jgi:hypothetical protein
LSSQAWKWIHPRSEPSIWVPKICCPSRARDSVISKTAGFGKLLRENHRSETKLLLLLLIYFSIISVSFFLFLGVCASNLMLLHRLACSPIRRNCFASVSSAYHYPGTLSTGILTGKPSGTAANLGHHSIRQLTASSVRRSDNMGVDDAFAEMEAAGVPKKGQPTAAAAPAQEQQKELPKLSAAEFRVYNRMAEHMDMFVRWRKWFPYGLSPS